MCVSVCLSVCVCVPGGEEMGRMGVRGAGVLGRCQEERDVWVRRKELSNNLIELSGDRC